MSGDEWTAYDHYASRREDLRATLAGECVTPDDDGEPCYDCDSCASDGCPDALSVEVERVVRIVLGTGGPHDEVRLTFRGDYLYGGEYVRAWSSMPGTGTVSLGLDEAQEWADAYCIDGRTP